MATKVAYQSRHFERLAAWQRSASKTHRSLAGFLRRIDYLYRSGLADISSRLLEDGPKAQAGLVANSSTRYRSASVRSN